MTDDKNDTLADSPKDAATSTVRERPGTEAEVATGDKRPSGPGKGATPAGQRNSAYHGNEPEGADHDTEEAAAYRENDA